MSQGKISGIGKISKPGDRFTARRRIHTGNPAAISRHNKQVGEVIYAYNHAQASCLSVLYEIIGWDKHQMTRVLWDSQSTDRSQRNLLRVYVTHIVDKKIFRNGLLWALQSMDALSEKRNDAVHSDVSWFYDSLGTGLLTKENRSERLFSQPLASMWLELRGDLSALSNYLSDLSLNLQAPDQFPLTKRPTLKLVPIPKRRKTRKSLKAL